MRAQALPLVLLLLCTVPFSLSAQLGETGGSPLPESRNEFGLDITGTALLFTQWGAEYYFYNSIYNLSYRRSGAKGNWRFGLGGYVQERELEPWHPDFEDVLWGYTREIQARAGYEWESQVASKWSAFYGLDLRGAYSGFKTTYGFGGPQPQVPISRRSTWSIGVAPVLGIRWRVSPRISLLTEAALAISYQRSMEEVQYLPVGEGIEALPMELESGVAMDARFIPPLAFFVTVDL